MFGGVLNPRHPALPAVCLPLARGRKDRAPTWGRSTVRWGFPD
jgi:hypothetical protein